MNKFYFTTQEHNVFNTPQDDSNNAKELRKKVHGKLLDLKSAIGEQECISVHPKKRYWTSAYALNLITKNISFMSLRYWDRDFLKNLGKENGLTYYSHIEIKVNQNGVFIGLYIGNYNKENTSGIKRNWLDIDRQLNELKEQGYFWEYDNAKEHYFSWITDLSHESVLLKRLDYSSNNYEMDSDDYGIDIDDIKKEIMTLYSLLKKLSS